MPATSLDVAPLRFLQLLADPIRWQLIDELAKSDRRVSELCVLVDKHQSLVSYHLGELRRAGLVLGRRSAADGRDSYYSVDLARCAEQLSAAGTAVHPGIQLRPSKIAPPPARRGQKLRVLFMCTGNSARSQMAEAFLAHRGGAAFSARSGGSHPKPLHPHAVQVMADRGIDISACRSKDLHRFTHERFDLVVTLCDKVREICPEFPGQPPATHWSMADPSAEDTDPDAGYAAFVRVADEIDSRVAFLIAQMRSNMPTQRRHK